ncbi:LCP family protein [Clostridium sp.]|uniref:LCP family protein n=1 Tax=Clostridium sp. TaxID=1506 RepID=UPI001A5F8E8C|nr:LCP family protein [Clostridium sp.]MBK5241572.1 LCP family protein [Clostridium sp.]
MKKDRKRKKIVNYKRFALVIIITLVTIVALAFMWIYYYLSGFNNNSVDLTKKNPTGNIEASDVEEIVKDGKSCNILVMGVDIGDPNSKSANDPKRTDTMILAHYNAESQKLDLISIPRDTLIKINNRNQKINAAHALGGVELAVASVEELLGIQIEYYGKINYEGFRSVIDAIGGVDMYIERTMDYDDSAQDLSIKFEKGTTVHLDGEKAEEFFRWRKNNDGSGFAEGDIDRIKNQQKFINKVMEKIKSPMILIKIPSILSAVQKNVETNMGANDIIKYGSTFATMNGDDISMDTIGGESKYIDNLSYYIYDEEKNKDIMAKLRNGSVQSIDKSKLKIKVLNGTKKVGLASDFSKYLKENGYNEVVIGNGEATSETIVSVNENSKDLINDFKNDFKINNIKISTSIEGEFDIIVLLGEDHELMH